MIKNDRWCDDRMHRVITALAINVIMLVIYLLLYYPGYETNDDSGINNIVSGIRGVRDPHVIYINYYWGVFIARLYGLAPNVAWTAVLQYIILFISFVSTTCVLMKILRSELYIPLIVGVMALYEYEGYVLLQYTKTSGLAAVAGLAIIFGELFSSKESKAVILLGVILCWISSMYRFQQYMATIAIFSIIVIYYLLHLSKLKDEERSQVKQKLVLAFVTATLLIGGSFGLLTLDKMQYSSDFWKEYTAYNKARTEVTDFGIPSYEKNEEKYRELGIDKSAFRLMRTWNIQDSEKFTTEVFESIASWRQRPKIDIQYAKSFIKSFIHEIKSIEIAWVFLLILLGWLLCGHKSIREIFVLLYGALITLLIYGYLFYKGRFFIHRVDVGIWFAISIILLWMYRPDKEKRGLIIGVIVLSLIAMCTFTRWDNQWRTNVADKRSAMAEEQMVIEELHSDSEHIYLTKVGEISFHKAYNAFDQAPFSIGDNIYSMGGWTAATELYQSILHKYGISNPYRDMINNDVVYLIDNDIDLTLNYLRTWYDEKVTAEEVKKIGNHTVYRIVSK